MRTRLIIVGALFLLLSISASAKIWRVNNNSGINADFTTAQEAHDGASFGDTLFFEGSPDSYGNLVMTKKLVIIGPGYHLILNENTQVSKASARITKIDINDGAQHSIIMGMDFYAHGGYQHDTSINTDSVTITRCKLNQINFVSASRTSAVGVVISQCFIALGGINYGYSSGNTTISNVIIVNNIIDGHGHISIKGKGHLIANNYISETVKVEGSKISSNIIKGEIFENETNALSYNRANVGNSVASYFTQNSESPDGYFMLAENSPAKGAGEGGIDCGPYGGVNPYVLSGIPKGPHIYDAVIGSSATIEDGLKISIKIKTQL